MDLTTDGQIAAGNDGSVGEVIRSCGPSGHAEEEGEDFAGVAGFGEAGEGGIPGASVGVGRGIEARDGIVGSAREGVAGEKGVGTGLEAGFREEGGELSTHMTVGKEKAKRGTSNG